MTRITTWTLAVFLAGLFGCGDDSSDGEDGATGDGAGTQDGSADDGDSGTGTDSAAELCPDPSPTEVIDVSVDALYGYIQTNETLAVIDVREPDETATGVIEGALLYPWTGGVLEADHADLPDDRALFVICETGGRSVQAAAFLIENGHDCVYNVLDGMMAWIGAGYPTAPP